MVLMLVSLSAVQAVGWAAVVVLRAAAATIVTQSVVVGSAPLMVGVPAEARVWSGVPSKTSVVLIVSVVLLILGVLLTVLVKIVVVVVMVAVLM